MPRGTTHAWPSTTITHWCCSPAATESIYSGPGQNTFVLNSRKGFIRLAIETGAALVPCYTFGENDTFAVVSYKNMPQWLHKARKKFQSIFGFTVPLISSIMPRAIDVTTVVGEPIQVVKCENPAPEEVQRVLDVFTERLQQLYAEYAPQHASPEEGLQAEELPSPPLREGRSGGRKATYRLNVI